jgi:hypothetical protein
MNYFKTSCGSFQQRASGKLLPIVLSMDLQTMDDEQTLMLELTLDLTKIPNENNDDANQKQ